MPWKKLLALATGQIDEALRQKLEFVLEESVAGVSLRDLRHRSVGICCSVGCVGLED